MRSLSIVILLRYLSTKGILVIWLFIYFSEKSTRTTTPRIKIVLPISKLNSSNNLKIFFISYSLKIVKHSPKGVLTPSFVKTQSISKLGSISGKKPLPSVK